VRACACACVHVLGVHALGVLVPSWCAWCVCICACACAGMPVLDVPALCAHGCTCLCWVPVLRSVLTLSRFLHALLLEGVHPHSLCALL
jgi:hypothetical protein